jgi:tRNA-specific 2-thiouridylase
MKKALIAMSGGVDSSVAAYLMKKAGYDCVGVTMRLFGDGGAGVQRGNCCRFLDDAKDAASVACRLGIPHYVLDFTADFRKLVIDRFVSAYEGGSTPNPCIDCNRYLKFGKLYESAEELGCDVVVTGHYARISGENGRYFLKKAFDKTKDQSYVLYSLSEKQLAHTVFPLGDMTKAEVRRIAEEEGFINARKRDSQDICFVPDGDYAKAIELYSKKQYPCGRFVDADGNTLGEHRGIIRYTIGQRKGLGIAAAEPLYVIEKRADKNEIVLGGEKLLYTTSLEVRDFSWISSDIPPKTLRAKVRTRYKQEETPATVRIAGENTVHVEFDSPVRAVSPGQAAVLYDGDTVLGGGTIC